MFDFAQAAFRIRQRNGCEQAEAAGMLTHEVGAIFVDPAREAARFLCIAEPDAGRGKRQRRGLHTVLVHCGEGLLRCPFQPGAADFAAPRACDPVAIFGEIERRNDVTVNVDQAASIACPRLSHCRGRACGAQGASGKAREKLTPRHGERSKGGIAAAKTAAQRLSSVPLFVHDILLDSGLEVGSWTRQASP
jgi:hypothetical protein